MFDALYLGKEAGFVILHKIFLKGGNILDRIRRNEADMHMHSNQSDGRNTVNELFSLVKKFKIKAAVLTDHDRVKGLKNLYFLQK